MARARVSIVPSTLEMTKKFEGADLDPRELEQLRASLTSEDVDADLQNVFGRLTHNLSFIRATWARFQQFVQRIRARQRMDEAEASGDQLTSGELATRFSTLPQE